MGRFRVTGYIHLAVEKEFDDDWSREEVEESLEDSISYVVAEAENEGFSVTISKSLDIEEEC